MVSDHHCAHECDGLLLSVPWFHAGDCAIVQAFEKIPALNALAPTQTEPPFKLTQLVVLVLFVLITIVAAIRFRPEPVRAV